MKLKKYLQKHKIKHREAAEALGVTRVWLTEVINGRLCSSRLAIKIQVWSHGQVKISDVLGD